MTAGTVAAVIIGRNEGERLKRCLATVAPQVQRVIYVDSGSTDGSVAHARSLGVEVVELDRTLPFTAARGRNAGAFALESGPGYPEFIQFIDGDCALEPGWISAAIAHLQSQPELGIVTGWRAEIDPERSVYNAMCDFEWHRPAGPIAACGGDMMVRTSAFLAQGGFNPRVIAAEDDEFCIRIRKSGLGIERLPLAMTRHDAAMTHFSQWWRRAIRAGHGFAQVGHMHPDHFRRERRRVWLFGLLLPALLLCGFILLLIGATVPGIVLLGTGVTAYLLSYLRTIRGLVTEGLPASRAARHSLYLSLSKFPNLMGMLTHHWRRFRHHDMNIIEYK